MPKVSLLKSGAPLQQESVRRLRKQKCMLLALRQLHLLPPSTRSTPPHAAVASQHSGSRIAEMPGSKCRTNSRSNSAAKRSGFGTQLLQFPRPCIFSLLTCGQACVSKLLRRKPKLSVYIAQESSIAEVGYEAGTFTASPSWLPTSCAKVLISSAAWESCRNSCAAKYPRSLGLYPSNVL